MNLNCNLEENRKLKIGPSCGYMNISALYECVNKLFLCLSYTYFDFIYNKLLFLSFKNPQKPESYISSNNDLITLDNIDSAYLDDISLYVKNTVTSIYPIKTEVVSNRTNVNLRELSDKYLSNNIPVIFDCDHYYMYNDYKLVTNDIFHFHTQTHQAILIDIDYNNNTATILDKFYSFYGPVSLDALSASIKSDYVKAGEFRVLSNFNELLINNSVSFEHLLGMNLKLINTPYYTAPSGDIYLKNSEAIESFRNDFKDIVLSLQDQKGKYAPQFLSKLIAPTILQRLSFKNFVAYYKNYFKNSAELQALTEQSYTLWSSIDAYNDKTYLTKHELKDNLQKYMVILDELADVDTKIYSKLKCFEMY